MRWKFRVGADPLQICQREQSRRENKAQPAKPTMMEKTDDEQHSQHNHQRQHQLKRKRHSHEISKIERALLHRVGARGWQQRTSEPIAARTTNSVGYNFTPETDHPGRAFGFLPMEISIPNRSLDAIIYLSLHRGWWHCISRAQTPCRGGEPAGTAVASFVQSRNGLEHRRHKSFMPGLPQTLCRHAQVYFDRVGGFTGAACPAAGR